MITSRPTVGRQYVDIVTECSEPADQTPTFPIKVHEVRRLFTQQGVEMPRHYVRDTTDSLLLRNSATADLDNDGHMGSTHFLE